MTILAQLNDAQQYGMGAIFLVGLVCVSKLLLDAHHKVTASLESQITKLEQEKAKLIARLEQRNDEDRKKEKRK